MTFCTVLICVVIALVSVVAYYFKRHLSYWKLRGIPHDDPDILLGSMSGFEKTRHWRTILKEYYDKYKGTGPFAGFFLFQSPVVMALDLDLVRNILMKDFSNFTDRGLYHNEIDDPLSAHIFNLDGAKWKKIRTKVSPNFTSGKIKFMLPTVVSVGDHLVETFNEFTQKEAVVEVKDIMARFTTDVIGTCAFGIECNSLKDPNVEFRTIGSKAFTLHRHGKLLEGFIFSFPKLARKLRMRVIHDEVHQFYMRVVRETVEYREKNNIKRNDFMNLLIEAKNSAEGLTIEEVAAQAFVFFFADFETSSTIMGFALYELAVNQDVQDKLRAEVIEQLRKHDGKFTYECMAEMNYMDKVMKETMRKYTVISELERTSFVDYPTSNPKYIIPKGTLVLIPVDAIHRDPDIYPDPEKFDPERFSPEETQKRHPCTWLPFGDGPRNCVGQRFGKMQIYIGLSMLLMKFKFDKSDKTPSPVEIDVTNFILSAKGGIHLHVQRINK